MPARGSRLPHLEQLNMDVRTFTLPLPPTDSVQTAFSEHFVTASLNRMGRKGKKKQQKPTNTLNETRVKNETRLSQSGSKHHFNAALFFFKSVLKS